MTVLADRPGIAAIVLAAGGSTRMGQSKQLLLFRGKTLVERAVLQAIEAELRPVIVVAGAQADAVRDAIAGLSVEIVQNEAWQTGMGSSIALGVGRLLEMQAGTVALAIVLADQPLVESKHLTAMRELLNVSETNIIAAQYSGMLGVPAFFKLALFAKLASLSPEAGARQIIRGSGDQVTPFPLPEAATDVDTPEDYAALTGSR